MYSCGRSLILSLHQTTEVFNAEVLFRQDATVDEFIDVIEAKSRSYLPCLYVRKHNKKLLKDTND
jgi:ribosome-interacting GTPase 1